MKLPAPGVRFAPGFATRVARLAARIAAARERREGAGQARLLGVGSEFVGFRPYRPGEDLRQLDWALFARTRKPFVRLARREASEEWAVLLDTSASMGVGAPGKLQLAAEVAAAFVGLAARVGARVRLFAGRERALGLRPSRSLAPVLAFLEATEARGADGLGALLAGAERLRGAGRVLIAGDLFDAEPEALLRVRRPGRELLVAQILAPDELAPSAAGEVEWWDAEAPERRVRRALDAATLAAYEARLHARLEEWRAACARHRVPYLATSSARPFEDVIGGLVG